MNPSDPSDLSVYERCDPAYLRDLREAAGMDVHVLARKACLSAGQLRELETGQSSNLFYSDAIKRQAYKRALMLLGAAPPQASATQQLNEPPQDLDARLAPLDSIVAMSHRPAMERSVITALQSYIEPIKTNKYKLGLFVVLAIAFVGMSRYVSAYVGVARQTATPLEPNNTATPVAVTIAAPTTPVVAASAPSVASTFKCAHSNEAMPQWTPQQPRKEGRYVYLVSGASVEVCVVDAQKTATHLKMKAGESQSVYGAGPWQVSGSNLQKIKIYFQGGLVMIPNPTTQALTLVEAPVSR
jgi:hypothetical protein